MAFDTVEWHFYAGYMVLGLVLFRWVWGFTGPAPIRFRTFIYTLGQIWQSLKQLGARNPGGYPGHNPIGALSVFALLASTTFQAVTGLFIEADDFFESGPLASYVSEEAVNRLSGWHHLNAKILLILIGLHLCAILFYWLWKKENLIKPMLTGWKWVKIEKGGEKQ